MGFDFVGLSGFFQLHEYGKVVLVWILKHWMLITIVYLSLVLTLTFI